jgi:putative superfamily III holin-X
MASYPGSSQGESAFERERISENRGTETSVTELVSGLVSDAQQLVRKEIDLAKQEVSIEIGKLRQGAVALGIGAGVAVIGAFLLAQMLVYLLQSALGLSLWVSYLIVGGLFAVIGGILLMQGVNRMKQVDPVPHETIESVRKDVEWIKEQSPSDKT